MSKPYKIILDEDKDLTLKDMPDGIYFFKLLNPNCIERKIHLLDLKYYEGDYRISSLVFPFAGEFEESMQKIGESVYLGE